MYCMLSGQQSKLTVNYLLVKDNMKINYNLISKTNNISEKLH